MFVNESLEYSFDSICRYELEEEDEKFCKKQSISESLFAEVVEELDKNFNYYVFQKLDSLELIETRSYCDICGYLESRKDQKMLICQGCGISVHNNCYVETEISDLRWLCKKCIFYFENGKCKFCKTDNGILKRTDDNNWSHVICALLNKSLSVVNFNTKDPIETFNYQPSPGFCSICNFESNSLIKCSYSDCKVKYHASCAAEKNYCDLANRITYCQLHDPISEACIRSKRRLLRESGYYSDIETEIFLRNRVPLSVPVENEYLKIARTEPFVVSKKYDQSDNHDTKQIQLYWISMRKRYWYNFNNIFIYANHFLRLDKNIDN